jgi:hypothetical protein
LVRPALPRSSRLSPRAPNEPDKEEGKAADVEGGYVEGARIVHGHVHAAAVRRDYDGDLASVATAEEVHDASDGPGTKRRPRVPEG